MARIQPVYGPDYGQMILQALGAYRGVKGMQASAARAEREQQEFEDLRFRRERAGMASQMQGMNREQRMNLVNQHIEKVKQRGGDPSNSQGLLDLYASNDPAQIQQADQAVRNAYQQGVNEGFIKPAPTVKPESRTALAKNLELYNSLPDTDPNKKIVLASLVGSQQKLEVSPDGTISLVSGKGLGVGGEEGPGKKAVGALEKDLIKSEIDIANLDEIKKNYEPSYLTFKGDIGSKWAAFKSKAGADLSPEEVEFVKGRRKFTQGVNQFYNAYRKDITGAAGAEKELRDLKKAVINVDLSPVEYEAAYEQFRGAILRTQRIKRKILRAGVKGSLKNKNSPAARQFDAMYLGGQDDSALDRIKDLQKEGKDENAIFQTLKNEGYKI